MADWGFVRLGSVALGEVGREDGPAPGVGGTR